MHNGSQTISCGRWRTFALATCLALLIGSAAGCQTNPPPPNLIAGTDVFFSTNSLGEPCICFNSNGYEKVVGWKLETAK